MAENKSSVLLYIDIIHTVKKLTDEQAGKLFKHYLAYINDLNPVPPDDLTEIVFEPIKQNLKRDLKTWESKCKKNSEIAKEGWIKRKSANASESIKTNAKNADKETVKDNDTDKIKAKVTKTLEQRKIDFSLSLNPFLETYTKEFGLNEAKEMLNKFYIYWSESNDGAKKFKKEMQKTWNLSARIKTWADNHRNFKKGKTQQENKFQTIVTSTNAAHEHIKAKHEPTGS